MSSGDPDSDRSIGDKIMAGRYRILVYATRLVGVELPQSGITLKERPRRKDRNLHAIYQFPQAV